MAGTLLQKISADEYEKARALSREKFLNDQAASLYTAKKRGRQEGEREGMRKGLLEGELKGKRDTVHNMLAEGIDIKLIAKVTGLT